jgi:hypothetical protein
MSHIDEKSDVYSPTANNNVRSWERGGPELAQRLKQALEGKNRSAVVAQAGLSERTLARGLSGQAMRVSNLKSLAEATAVSIDWLIDGLGPMRHLPVGSTTEEGHLVVQGPTMPLVTEPTTLFSSVNMDRLGEALAAADTLFAIQGKDPSPRERAQVQALMYDMMTREAERNQSSSSDTSLNPGDRSGIG